MTKQIQNEKLAAEITSDPRWQSIVARNKESDGKFFYSVRSTGVYCRPACGARLARPENVQFFATTEAAEKAGFRACKRCKRCKPAGLSLTKANTAKIEKVCRLIERCDETPSLEKLAECAGMSIFHLHRTFKAVTGLTPNGYRAAQRTKRVRETLGKSQSVTDAIYDAGFNSNSRFYESANESLGMTPTSFRDGGVDTVIHFAIAECSLGPILVAKSVRGVCAVLMGDDPLQLARDLQDQFPKADLVGDESGYEDIVAKVIGLIEEPCIGLDLPLDIRGTAFQQRVWKALQRIPVGVTASYADIAKAIGMRKTVRAVAQACGANTLAVAIPCHRVIRNDGALSGYRWGVQRKRALLDREAQA
ncbi:bifunctional DNA-binding transcriptional regulator/O6-methylguanine-DNA methyltransferase Ada [Granulicella arctica]|uniref:methylated-DNA--[protein]-cysteine S-methyltransferase n=1 Tax=Granulicella arctica TaxID=940613 RepID=A0A7Y9TLY3_9BACT|nr:bifunctional DNA-binding transcriptional regulator/O6-methylguanine-DNA methyltransferase Ada [Granulicella arctica]NYF80607.1 AraC family transcriptional regulator of adaptative response/methylated-DNA-[protein]-cysteine methyltransferase [Granulicella arctica]